MQVNMKENHSFTRAGSVNPGQVYCVKVSGSYCTRRHSLRIKWLFPSSIFPRQPTYVEQLSVVVIHNLKKCLWIFADQEIKYLIRARGRVQASLKRIQTFVQQYDRSRDILNIELHMGRLGEMWNKYEDIQDRLESTDCDPSENDDFRNDFKRSFTT